MYALIEVYDNQGRLRVSLYCGDKAEYDRKLAFAEKQVSIGAIVTTLGHTAGVEVLELVEQRCKDHGLREYCAAPQRLPRRDDAAVETRVASWLLAGFVVFMMGLLYILG